MRNRFVALAAVLALAALVPNRARADTFDTPFCTANSLSVCMDFNLTDNGSGDYTLVVTYVSSADGSGLLTAGGIYDTLASPTFTFTDVTLTPLTGWSLGCNGLNGAPASSFTACASTTNGVNNALAEGGSFTITFHSNQNIAASDFGPNGELGYRSHIQSLGVNNCSVKPDNRLAGNVVDGVSAVDARCGTTTTPEPISSALIATGLLGMMGVGIRRRRRGADVVND